MKETGDKVVVWRARYRFDIPKSAIIVVGRNVILGMDYVDVFRHRVDRDAPLPVGSLSVL